MTTAHTEQSLRFVQLSDPHLTSLQGVRWRELANKRILGYLSWKKRRRAEHRPEILDALQHDLASVHPDHIVVTGDLTHIGLHDEFRQARRWLESLGTPGQVTVIPGNHDSYIRTSWMQSYAHWEPYMASDTLPSVSHSDAASLFPSLRVRGPVAFIGVSSARPSAPFLATGSVGDQQLQRLSDVLEKTARQGLFRVVMIHHPPVPGEEKWRKRLTDAAAFCEVIRQRGAELILHGHSHRSVESAVDIPGANVPVFGIPSASAMGHKAGRAAQYFIYEVLPQDSGWMLNITVRGFRADKKRFVYQQARSLHISQP